jgi:hypothetical protein
MHVKMQWKTAQGHHNLCFSPKIFAVNTEDDTGEIREGEDYIYLAQGSAHWGALVDMVMNFRIPYLAGNFLTS